MFSKQNIMILLTLLLIQSCFKEEVKFSSEQTRMLHSEIVYGHSKGTVSRFAQIKILFNKELGEVGKDAAALLELTPAIDAKIAWLDKTTIGIKPTQAFAENKEYRVELKLSKWKAIKKDVPNYTFNFKTIEQSAGVTVDEPTFNKEDGLQEVSGVIVLADQVIDNNKIQQTMSAALAGETKKINWDHSTDGLQHRFRITKIKRIEKEINLDLIWDFTSIGLQEKSERTIKIEPYNGFAVKSIDYITSNKSIKVYFNDIIDTKQNFKGLVVVNDGAQEVSYQVDGNVLDLSFKNTAPKEFNISIHQGVRNQKGNINKVKITKKIKGEKDKPLVKFVNNGVILPYSKKATVALEAVSVDSIQVTAFRIYQKNIGQFLQKNDFDGDSDLKKVGRYLWRKTIKLPGTREEKLSKKRYNIDVSELLKGKLGDLYRLEVSINRTNSLYECNIQNEILPIEKPFQNLNGPGEKEKSGWDFSQTYYVGDNYDYANRENPCTDAYYFSYYSKASKTSRNIFYTNLGAIVKRGDDKTYHFITTNLSSAKPAANVDIAFFNYQNQLLKKTSSNKLGMGKASMDGTPFYMKLSLGSDTAYLRLHEGASLPVTHFDIGGERSENGLKGYIYTERDVWRPGNEIHAVFVLHDPTNNLPSDYPVELKFLNPKGQEVSKSKPERSLNNFYYFKLKTNDDAITGSYKAEVRIGSKLYSKVLKIATIVPNRLKAELEFTDEALKKGDIEASIFSEWLHGAKASNLRATVSVDYTKTKTAFDSFTDFIFQDETRSFSSSEEQIYEGELDEDGKKSITLNLVPSGSEAPGMLMANFKTRVFEKSGGFSVESISQPFHPYDAYVGLKAPKGDVARGMLLTDKSHDLQIVTVDQKGKSIGNKSLEVSLYKISWKWWWDKKSENLANFSSSQYTENIANEKLTTDSNGFVKWPFEIKYPKWGRYIFRACLENGKGHCSTKIVYIDWPGWAGRAQDVSGIGATRLNISSDKKKYTIGEEATIFLPKTKAGSALVSVEGGNKIFKKFWVELTDESQKIKIAITEGMAPNVYVHVSLIQPHKGKVSETPLRLYGITPLLVTDSKTKLEPLISAPVQVKPSESFTVKVKERNKREMTYTLAVVDEGLLGLTKFRTPKLHKIFYKKESLGVLTWDYFDQVLGAYPAKLERILSLGGDEGSKSTSENNKKRRFPPLAKFIGPFELKSGEQREHKIKLPDYLGAVRVMAVSGNNKSYGSDQKTILVKDDLMLLPTLPRVLGPGDKLKLPMTVFALNEKIKSVNLSIEHEDKIKLVGESNLKLDFDKPSEKIISFPIEVGEVPSSTVFKFRANSSGFKAQKDIHIKIRKPNPVQTKLSNYVIQAGEKLSFDSIPFGVEGTNNIKLEVSNRKPISLEHRLGQLIRYPHGCLEQTTSALFPQIYLSEYMNLTDERKKEIQKNIDAGINKLKTFQTINGGFSYWPGSGSVNEWSSNYVGHFLIEAKRRGFGVPSSMLNPLITHQEKMSNRWVSGTKKSSLTQSYRLLMLARAGKPDIASMNRLRGTKLSTTAKWQLALALLESGFKDQAKRLVKGLDWKVNSYQEGHNTFGSTFRDYGIILSATSKLNPELAATIFEKISEELSSDKNLNTQEISFALLGSIDYLGPRSTKSLKFEYKMDKENKSVNALENIFVQEFKNIGLSPKKLDIKNNSKNALYITLSAQGAPGVGKETTTQSELELVTNYSLSGESESSLDIVNLKQGSEFIGGVTIKNSSKQRIENVALEFILPAGVEIFSANHRPEENSDFDFQDVRDDRVHTYFGIEGGSTKTFEFLLHATHEGRFYFPATKVEAMYDSTKSAQQQGQWINISK